MTRPMKTLAQDFLLLVLDEAAGAPLISGGELKYGLAGAVLADLALAGRLRLTGGPVGPGTAATGPKGPGMIGPGTIEVRDATPLGDPVLDASLRELAEDKPRSPQAVLTRLSRDIRPRVVDQLVDGGVLHREDGRIVGAEPRAEWPEAARQQERELRDRLRQVIVVGRRPDDRMAALIELLAVCHALTVAMPAAERRGVAVRAKQIAKEPWDSPDVQALVAATATAITGIVAAAVSETLAEPD